MKKKLLFLIPAFVGMSVFTQAQQKVGVNTTDPQATLDINGNMAIEKVEDAANESISNLYWDESDHQVKTKDTSEKLFYLVDYSIECTGGDDSHQDGHQSRQWVGDFDTGIPTDQYNIVFSSAVPYDRDPDKEQIDIDHVAPENGSFGYSFGNYYYKELSPFDVPAGGHVDGTYEGRSDDANRLNPFLRKDIWADSNTKTWHFDLGYAGASPSYGGWYRHQITYRWVVRLLVIPKKNAKYITDFGRVTRENNKSNPIGSLNDSPIK